MEFSAKKVNLSKQKTACIVVGVFENQRLTDHGKTLDATSRGYLQMILKRGDLSGKVGRSLLLHAVPGLAAERVLLVGCGPEKDMDDARFLNIMTKTAEILRSMRCRDIVFTLHQLKLRGHDLDWKARQAAQLIRDRLYTFDYLKKRDPQSRPILAKILLAAQEASEVKPIQRGITQGVAIADGVDLAKDLGNLPANVCTPTYLAKRARELAKGVRTLSVQVLEERDLRRLKMGSFLSVTRGSRQPPKLITLQYKGGKTGTAPVVLVGKGITFDSGGISIKPSAAMDEMKYDMCGAASVLGALAAVSRLKLPINVVGIIPTCENLPDGNASKPGDIVTSMSGQTIEILNTDAEGRLILCDALTYAGRYKPDTVIDIATLTGACVIALGKHATGLIGNHQPLIDSLLAAGVTAADRAWQMPLWEEYQDQLQSNFADMANVGGREGGTITAACFLSRFTKDYRWAHLDIAGTAWRSGSNKGGTGRPVPLLIQYLIDKAGR
ncbi:MAG: leucyl aminopeptidase [Gammaproteobacteria bacterium]|nr:leucyl aminopeptidase [Gammaproteobacteria bacterium]